MAGQDARPASPRPPAPTRPRTGIAVLTGLIALSAYGGALGLIFGFLDLGTEVTRRLPFDSPVLSGIALMLFVAFPASWSAWLAWRDDLLTDVAVLVNGVVLIFWVLMELAVIRTFSFLQPLFFVLGILLVYLGRQGLTDMGIISARPVAGQDGVGQP